MYVQKSFISNTNFANNMPGFTAQLGELSSYGSSFARDKGYYANKDIAANLLLTTFISKDGEASIPVPALIATQTLTICNFVYNQTLGGDHSVAADVLLENLLTQYAGLAGQFECGNIISDGTYSLPEWVQWKNLTDTAHPDNIVKVWFVDASFQTQYDEYEIYVIAPFTNLDDFFKSGPEVELEVRALLSSETMDRIQAMKSGYPETIIRTNTYNYVDPLNTLHTVPTDWTVLIYGPSGDNIDSIKDALMAFILANSTHTRPQWIPLLPDIFKRTEFIIVPLEDQYAIPNLQQSTGIYSPQVKLSTAVAKMKLFASQYPDSHIDSNLTTMGHPYRSLALLVIGSPDNRLAKYLLSDYFPDFISVASSSIDFNRMSQVTQDWAVILENLISVAESMGDFTTIPVGMQKIHRDGILYLAKSYMNVNYLVVAKASLIAATSVKPS